jgi:predicted dehydrogenase
MKIAVIGCCGHSKAALDQISASNGRQILCGFAGLEEDNIAGLRRKIGELGLDAPYYKDYRELLEREKPDACIVDSVFYRHAQTAAAALSMGIATYCEKPLALDLAGLELVRKAQKSTGALLWAMQTARYDPWFYTAHSLIRQGAVGQVLMLNGQKSYTLGNRGAHYRARETYGGSIPWVAIHSIDLIHLLSGSAVETVYAVQSTKGNRGHGELESYGQIVMTMTGGVQAGINFDLLRPGSAPTHGDDRIRVAGTEGVLEVRANQLYLLDQNGMSQPELQSPPTIWRAFLDAAAGVPGLITTESSLESTRIALLARQSADTGKLVPVEVTE